MRVSVGMSVDRALGRSPGPRGQEETGAPGTQEILLYL